MKVSNKILFIVCAYLVSRELRKWYEVVHAFEDDDKTEEMPDSVRHIYT